MPVVALNKGSDLTISVNGEVLGGVKALRRVTENKSEGIIYQFLTDKPVARVESKRYTLELVFHCSGPCVLDNAVNSICVCGKDKTELYTHCTVEKLERTAEADGAVEYRAVIAAEERSDIFE